MHNFKILVIVDGEPIQVETIEEAQQIADEKCLDLIEVSKNVYKIMNHGKYLYDKQKGAKQQKQVTKEAQFTISIAPNDLKRKIKDICKWLQHGDNVRVIVKLRGRETQHPEFGMQIMQLIIEDANVQELLIETPNIKKALDASTNGNISAVLKPKK